MLRSAAPCTALLLFLTALLPAPADAQRRYRVAHDDDDRGTDLQLIARGLQPNGVGLRFWLGPQTAVTTRVDFNFTDFEDPDATLLGLGAALGLESHLWRSGRVHPYFSLGGHVGVVSFSSDATNDTDTQTVFGGEAGLGAEARLFDGLTLGARYELAIDAVTGDDAVGGGVGMPAGGQPELNVRLGGVPRVALSFRF